MNVFRRAIHHAIVVLVLMGLGLHAAMADPVQVDPLSLTSQSSLTGPLATYGNRIGTPYHETSLKRVEGPSPGMAPHGGLLRMFSSLDVQWERWTIAEKGDRFPEGNGEEIPYVNVGDVTPPPAIIPSEIFYVAFVWDYNFLTPSGSEVYGWAKLQAPPPVLGVPLTANPDLILLASATTNDDRGIIVGEYRVVPEPTAVATMAAGTALMACRMRRIRQKRRTAPVTLLCGEATIVLRF